MIAMPANVSAKAEKVIIVGGGLAGLLVARELDRAGFAFELLEARDRLGGRILSVDANGNHSGDGFDLGPSWFWPEMQPALAALIGELGLADFRQHEQGDIVVQYRPDAPPERYPGGSFQQSASARVVGGTGAIIDAIAATLPAESIRRGLAVRSVALGDGSITVECRRAGDDLVTVSGSHLVIAMPPRLLAETILLDPPVDARAKEDWRRTSTWMAPHAKFFALYEKPFWREIGLSGAGRSVVGPLGEVHDATTASGNAALFGFVGVPARQRAEAGEEVVVAAAIRQLTAMFGLEAGKPIATLYKDWASDPFTATAADMEAPGHPDGCRSAGIDGLWAGRLFLAGSEASAREPGYLAGAVDAARRAVTELVRTVKAGARQISSSTTE
ncbi:MAG TPA: FAD-dependent oxidoreductase [Bosea sp. (in: a-proteobacteria)]|jgi:monoamine oxidase|uniref:flavin monoamine oxidase family protein n=1 Tax=Bosea sp. (in: a-proteobacteria) TaxID=1871050 RepID=UPI002E136700|nr:FAD-dependent oxidoreductase [Bosea sp. (in: a-proteobacteria)]